MEAGLDLFNYKKGRKHLDKLMSSMTQERKKYESTWKELARYIKPGRFISGLEDDTSKKDTSRYNDILNNTATQASDTLSSGMMSGVTSR